MGLSMLDLFKDYLHLQPAEMQVMSAIISFPWCIKLLYGLIADNIPIFGSRRRSYLVINGIIAFLALVPLIPNGVNNKYIITACLTIFSINTAFLNVVIDALMVSQSRKDIKHGSQDLNSYAYSWMSVGGIAGTFLAAFLT